MSEFLPSDQVASWRYLGMIKWEETTGQSLKMLKGLHILPILKSHEHKLKYMPRIQEKKSKKLWTMVTSNVTYTAEFYYQVLSCLRVNDMYQHTHSVCVSQLKFQLIN